ncbi:Ger(x)C family spore germination protein [Paenibacillus ihbetae]|uniref:Uncharacterized protein n=1 Tax=Paenibacillus ihbetae TaxID=1870820 RepID=A0ABX3JVE1_9BACL|nr:Ger(x)C family spore germination protein [Paenibacillus ihbetae]OOC61315.1 hypothetical protein BBD40_05085 [Paenibacillus ihbetae]
MRRLGIFSLLFVLALSQTGCWNRTELNEIGLIAALGIDRGEAGWIVTYQLINPSAISAGTGGATKGGGGESPVHVFSSVGPTLREAIDVSYTESPRRLYFPHADILVLGKEAASRGIQDIIDFYWRNAQLRENVNVLVASGQASEMLKQLIPPERLPGAAIANISRQTDHFNSNYPSIKMYELTRNLDAEARAAGVPQVELVGESQARLESMDQLNRTSTPAKVRITGLAVFRKDRRVGALNRNESIGISWLTGKVRISTLSVSCPGSNKETEKFSFQTISAKTNVKPRKQGDEYTMLVSVKAKGRITESNCSINLGKLSNLHAAEKGIEEVIKEHMREGWAASKRLHADLPHFADDIHRKYPKDWRSIKNQWEADGMNSIKLVLQVNVTISQTGMTQKAFKSGVR